MTFKGLFIGIDRYVSAEINWLSCATRDATALHALFSDSLGGETTLLTDGQATVAGIQGVLRSGSHERPGRGCSHCLLRAWHRDA